MPDDMGLVEERLAAVWSDDWSKAPRDGTEALLRLHNGGVHIARWSTSYSVFGLGGCWTDGLSTMGDKIDYGHWAPMDALREVLWAQGKALVAKDAAIERLLAERDELRAAISTPEALHANMLRGGIPMLTIRQALHLHGADALATWDNAVTAVAERDEARAAVEEYDALFDLTHAAGMRAVDRWRLAHPGNDLVLPDTTDLNYWLIARVEAMAAALKPFAEFAPYVEMFVSGRAAFGGSPILPTKHFRKADFDRARQALQDSKP